MRRAAKHPPGSYGGKAFPILVGVIPHPTAGVMRVDVVEIDHSRQSEDRATIRIKLDEGPKHSTSDVFFKFRESIAGSSRMKTHSRGSGDCHSDESAGSGKSSGRHQEEDQTQQALEVLGVPTSIEVHHPLCGEEVTRPRETVSDGEEEGEEFAHA